MDVKKLVKPNIRSLRAYHAEGIDCKVKLDANESPFGFRVLESVETNRYPDPEAKLLRKSVARDCRVKFNNVLHGNGSDELIAYLIMTFGGPVLYPSPTFSMYGIISASLGEKKIEIPLANDFDLDIKKILANIKTNKPKLTLLSSPNNPTGNCFSHEYIEAIISKSPGIVVVDEAYQPFSRSKSYLTMLRNHENLVVLRTLSKIGLAALRTGFLVADPKIITEVNKVRLPFNLNSLSQRFAVDALKNKNKIKAFIKSIISERKNLIQEMNKIDGINVYPSDANFILFRVDDADHVFNALLKKGVLIRNMKGTIDGCLRVTVGTHKENRFFIKCLKQIF